MLDIGAKFKISKHKAFGQTASRLTENEDVLQRWRKNEPVYKSLGPYDA